MSEVLKTCGHNPDLCLTVTGFGDAGAALVASSNVDKIIFTGSPQVCSVYKIQAPSRIMTNIYMYIYIYCIFRREFRFFSFRSKFLFLLLERPFLVTLARVAHVIFSGVNVTFFYSGIYIYIYIFVRAPVSCDAS